MLSDLLKFYYSPSFVGALCVMVLVLSIFLMLQNRSGAFYVIVEYLFESVLGFFESIMGKDISKHIISYVVVLFFIILLSNMLGVILEMLAPIFGTDARGNLILYHYVLIPSADINFNLALALLSMMILLGVQIGGVGVGRWLYDYFPIFGKDYITIEKNDHTHPVIYWFQASCIKLFDIILSLFLGLLDIIGLLAKVISLSFRLFGNMTAGTVLLGISVVGLSGLTQNWFGFSFPVFFPVIVYLQEILVGVIQAFVFALLVAIFIQLAVPEETSA